jgi:excisionase family DNA binding protein
MKITVQEAAKLVGCVERTIQKYCTTGKIKAQKFGERVWIIDKESVENFIKNNKKEM